MEEWRIIEEFPDYEVSDQGQVRNRNTGRLPRQPRNLQGYGLVGLQRDGRKYTRSVTILVASTFLEPDPRGSEFMTPIHKDGNKANTRVNNLVYRSRAFAIAYHRQFDYFRFHRKLSAHGIEIPIHDVETGDVYEDSTEAAIRNGLLDNDIAMGVLNGTPVFPTGQRFAIHN